MPPKPADRRIALNICITVKGLSPSHSAHLRRALPASTDLINLDFLHIRQMERPPPEAIGGGLALKTN